MRIYLAALCLVVAACGTDDTSPMIADLTYSPMTVTVGQQFTVSGTMTFDDPDGDLAQLGIEVTSPGGMRQTLPMADLQGTGTMTEGTLTFAITSILPAAGSYGFSLWITDDAGNQSNRLDGTLTAQ